MLKTTLAGPALVLSLLLAAGCGGGGEEADESKPNAGSSNSPSQAGEGPPSEPDLSDIPKVVAEVNGEAIERAEFVDAYTVRLQQAASQPGAQVDQEQLRQQTVDGLVSTELLRQEADRQQIDVSDDEVARELTSLAEQNGMKSSDQFLTALKRQGLTAQEVHDRVRDQVVIGEVVSAEAGDTTATRAETKKLYKQLVAQQKQAGGAGGAVPPFAQVAPQLKQQVESQKESAAAQKLVNRLRSDAEITLNL